MKTDVARTLKGKIDHFKNSFNPPLTEVSFSFTKTQKSWLLRVQEAQQAGMEGFVYGHNLCIACWVA